MMEEYLGELIKKGFVVELQEKSGKTYEITGKGNNYLDKYGMIREFTESFGLGGD